MDNVVQLRNRTKYVCRHFLGIMAGTYEEDAVKETFGAPACELDCNEGCPGKNRSQYIVIGYSEVHSKV